MNRGDNFLRKVWPPHRWRMESIENEISYLQQTLELEKAINSCEKALLEAETDPQKKELLMMKFNSDRTIRIIEESYHNDLMRILG